MAKEEKKVKVEKDYKIKSTLLSLAISDKKEYKGRVNFTLAERFDGTNEKGEPEKKDFFSLDPFYLARQLGAVSFPMKNVVLAFSNGGKNLCIEALAMLLIGAEIEVERVFHEQGEEREYSEQPYEHDTYSSKIVSINALNPDPFTVQLIQQTLKDHKQQMQQQQPAIGMIPTL